MQGVERKSDKERAAAKRRRRLEAMNLQAIEGNPLDADDVAMFGREGWSDEQCRTYILSRTPAIAK